MSQAASMYITEVNFAYVWYRTDFVLLCIFINYWKTMGKDNICAQ
jgi:hypothetical protein